MALALRRGIRLRQATPTTKASHTAVTATVTAILMLGLLALGTSLLTERYLTRIAADALRSETAQLVAELRVSLVDAQAIVANLARDPAISRIAQSQSNPEALSASADETPLITALNPSRHPSLALLTQDGQLRALAGSVSDKLRQQLQAQRLQLAQAWAGSTLILNIPADPNADGANAGGRPADQRARLIAVAPVRDNQQRVNALLMLEIGPGALLYVGAEGSHDEPADVAMVINKSLQVLATQDPLARPAVQTQSPADTRGENVSMTPFINNRGTAAVAAWRWLTDYSLGVVVERDADVALRAVAYLNPAIFGLTVLAAALLLMVMRALRKRDNELSETVAQRTQQLLDNEARIQHLFEHAPSGLITLDEKGRISNLNRRAQAIFDRDQKAVIGKPLASLFAEPLPPLDELHEDEKLEINGCSDNGLVPLELSVSRRKGEQQQSRLAIVHDITDAKRLEAALRSEIDRRHRSESRQTLLLHSAGEGIFGIDRDQRISFLNPAAATMLGARPDELLGRKIGHDARDTANICSPDCPLLHLSPGEDQNAEISLQRQDGSSFDAVYTLSWMKADDEFQGAVVVFSDISDRKKSEKSLELAESVFQHITEGIVITDGEGYILRVNRALSEMVGYPEEALVGLKQPPYYSGEHAPVFYNQLWDSLQNEGFWEGELWNRHKNGKLFPTWQTIVAVQEHDGGTSRFVSVSRDITEQRHSQQRIHRLAYFDTLTELPNRELFFDRFGHAIQRAVRQKTQLALLFLDLDRFKNINDSLGHPIGDKLLQAVAVRLKQLVRGEDTVARLGGDEFTVLLESVGNDDSTALVAQKVVDALSSPFEIDGHSLHIGTSIGISLFPADGEDATTLVKHADAAMYQAKAYGRNNFQFFDTSMASGTRNQIALETRLHRAIHNEEFVLYYQAQFGADGQVVGVEALIRWMDPVIGMIPPGQFIPLAEETGLIVVIGEWALRTACYQMKSWLDRGAPAIRMSVNLAGPQIVRGNIVETVSAVLEETGLPAEHLELEVTETFVMDHVNQSVDTLAALRALGVRIAIDDFGTGHSSLASLKRLPTDTLKIDRAFVSDIPEDRNDMAIVRAVLAMAKELELDTVAEGVETQEQKRFLTEEGCTFFQGFLLARPLPPEAVEPMWQHHRHIGLVP